MFVRGEYFHPAHTAPVTLNWLKESGTAEPTTQTQHSASVFDSFTYTHESSQVDNAHRVTAATRPYASPEPQHNISNQNIFIRRSTIRSVVCKYAITEYLVPELCALRVL